MRGRLGMREAFLRLPRDEQSKNLRALAPALSRAPSLLEKDIWVCWGLQHLFAMPGRLPMAFKGGTSLSKQSPGTPRPRGLISRGTMAWPAVLALGEPMIEFNHTGPGQPDYLQGAGSDCSPTSMATPPSRRRNSAWCRDRSGGEVAGSRPRAFRSTPDPPVV